MSENIFSKIKDEHVEFKEMLSKLENAGSARKDTYKEFKKELIAHNQAEEQTLYEALKSDKKGKEMALVGTEEHRMGSTVVHKLDTAKGEEWIVQLKLLKHLLEKHIEVEEAEVIPKAEKMLNQTKVNQLSEEFENIEEKLEE